MAYIFSAITGGQNVGQAFTRVNQNLAAIEDNQGGVSGDYLPLSGGTLTGNVIITDSNTLRVQDNTDVNSIELNINSIDFRDDYNSVKTRLQYTPFNNSDAAINMIDTLSDGYMVIVPTPSGEGGKSIIVNGSGNGWEYVDLDAKFLQLTGGTLTGGLTGTTFALGEGSYFNTLSSNTLTANRIVNLPNKDGTIAMLSDIPSGGITGVTSAGTGNRLLLSGTVINNNLIQKSLSGGTNITITESNGTLVLNNTQSTSGFVQNTGDTISGLYTINDGAVDGARIDMVGTAPLVYLEGDAPTVRLLGTDVISKLNLYSNQIVFDNNGAGASSSSIVISPLLTTTGSSIISLRKLTGNTSGEFVIVPNITGNEGRLVRVNNNATGFNLASFSGLGSVSVSTSTDGYTIVGSGATRVQSAGTGTINIISSITNNTLVYRTLTQGTGVVLTQTNGDITIAANPSQGTLFNSLGNTFANTSTAETSVIFSSVRGGTTLSASTATTLPQQTTGRRYRFTANGTLQSAASAGNLIARMKIGSVLLASSTTAVHNSIPANTNFFIECTFTVRTEGAAASIQSRGIMHTTHTNFVSNGSNSAPISPATTSSIDTRTAKLFDFTLQWGTSNASNAWVINEATLEYLDI
jgi:hypothetical protein